ncbi:hypothetical protein ACJX0J_007170, partial [Zea mays]
DMLCQKIALCDHQVFLAGFKKNRMSTTCCCLQVHLVTVISLYLILLRCFKIIWIKQIETGEVPSLIFLITFNILIFSSLRFCQACPIVIYARNR